MGSPSTTLKEKSQRCWTRQTALGWCQRQRRRHRGDEECQINVDRTSNLTRLPESNGGASYKQAWRPQGQCLRTQFCTAKSHRLHFRRKLQTTALTRFLAGHSEKRANKSRSSASADII